MSKVKNSPVSLKRSVLKKTILLAAFVLPVVALAAFGGYYFKKYNDLKNNPVTAQAAAEAEEKRTIDAVTKLYDLPDDEKAVIASVQDVELLKKQYPGYFDKAEVGDKLLLYEKAALAILYRPKTNQLIRVSPLQVQKQAVIKVVGRAGDREAIEKALTDAKVTFKNGGDPKGTPTGITIIDLKGTNATVAQNLANIVKGQVGQLPAGEDKPTDADILIIIGPAVTPTP